MKLYRWKDTYGSNQTGTIYHKHSRPSFRFHKQLIYIYIAHYSLTKRKNSESFFVLNKNGSTIYSKFINN
jgi:hypothetical protein